MYLVRLGDDIYINYYDFFQITDNILQAIANSENSKLT